MNEEHSVIQFESISQFVYRIRGKNVMLDKDLSRLYGVETKVLNQSVTRNIERFPDDFMFKTTWDEVQALRSQNVTLKRGKHTKYTPRAFTEQGIAMLSSVLKSERAIQVNIQIMRTFTRLRQMMMSHEGLKDRIEKMEKKYDRQFQIIFEAINGMLVDKEKPRKEIGFKPDS